MSTTTPKLFISYRREESAGHAGRIYDAVAERFGDDGVFMDVTLAPGIDFVEQIERAVGNCHVLLVVIGPNWATISHGDGPRLAAPEDFVRLEVQAALERDDVLVVPVLVGGARMPGPAALPERLRSLARLQALELSDQRWRYDLGRLMDVLQTRLSDATGVQQAAPARAPQAPAQTQSSWGVVLYGVLLAAAAAIAGHYLIKPITRPSQDEEHTLYIALGAAADLAHRAIFWALVGAVLGGLLLSARGRGASIGGGILKGALSGAAAGFLGGLVAIVPGYLADFNDQNGDGNTGLPAISDGEQILSIALTGAIVGYLLGSLWRTRRPWSGFAIGLVAGAAIQALLIGGEFGLADQVVQTVVICGSVLTGLALLDRLPVAEPVRAGDAGRWAPPP